MNIMTFEDYQDDMLHGHESDPAIAYANYLQFTRKASSKIKHPDHGLKLAELKSKVERLLNSQKITIERNGEKDTSLASSFVSAAEQALASNVKKADLLDLITMSSAASRHINSQKGS